MKQEVQGECRRELYDRSLPITQDSDVWMEAIFGFVTPDILQVMSAYCIFPVSNKQAFQ